MCIRDRCEVVLDSVLAKQPDHSMATLLRGFVAVRRGQLERAEATFRSSLASGSESVLALRGLALALRGQSRWEDLSATATSWIAFYDDDRPRSLKPFEHRARAW